MRARRGLVKRAIPTTSPLSSPSNFLSPTPPLYQREKTFSTVAQQRMVIDKKFQKEGVFQTICQVSIFGGLVKRATPKRASEKG